MCIVLHPRIHNFIDDTFLVYVCFITKQYVLLCFIGEWKGAYMWSICKGPHSILSEATYGGSDRESHSEVNEIQGNSNGPNREMAPQRNGVNRVEPVVQCLGDKF